MILSNSNRCNGLSFGVRSMNLHSPHIELRVPFNAGGVWQVWDQNPGEVSQQHSAPRADALPSERRRAQCLHNALPHGPAGAQPLPLQSGGRDQPGSARMHTHKKLTQTGLMGPGVYILLLFLKVFNILWRIRYTDSLFSLICNPTNTSGGGCCQLLSDVVVTDSLSLLCREWIL